MNYNVAFGSAFSVDQFGFVRKGQIKVDGDKIIYLGKKSWSTIAKLGVFFLIAVLPIVLFRFGLGFFLALVVIHYLCASDGNLSISKSSISDVERKGRHIKFKGEHPESGKIKKTVFKVDCEENAISLENELKSR